jgi:hypothetical protein
MLMIMIHIVKFNPDGRCAVQWEAVTLLDVQLLLNVTQLNTTTRVFITTVQTTTLN